MALSNLDVVAPFTYVETYSSPAADCATDPGTVTQSRTVYVNGNSYLALVRSFTIQFPTTFYCTYTYPDLILTLLSPGDVIVEVFPRLISRRMYLILLFSDNHLENTNSRRDTEQLYGAQCWESLWEAELVRRLLQRCFLTVE
jgi:hypothetical protein